jgi:hypothetical protein
MWLLMTIQHFTKTTYVTFLQHEAYSSTLRHRKALFYYHTTKHVLYDTDIYWLKYEVMILFLNTLQRVIKFRAMRWAEHVARVRKRRGPYSCLVGNLRERDNLADFSVYEKLILRWMYSNLLLIRYSPICIYTF